jgi:hypothetical protein
MIWDMGGSYSTTGRGEKYIQHFGRKTGGKNHSEDLDADGRIILKWIREKQGERCCGLDSSGSGLEPEAGSYEHCNEPSGTIKCGEFIDSLSGTSKEYCVT